MLDTFVLTDSTTRDELIARVNDLDEEIQKLKIKIDDQNMELEDFRLAPAAKDRLAEAASLMADLGRIHNTPKAKADWIAGS